MVHETIWCIFRFCGVLEYLSDRVREVEDQMKRIADQVYKVGKRPDEADSRSDIQSR
jgi:hypothetical protein